MKSLNVLVIEESGKNSLNMVLTCWGHVPTFFSAMTEGLQQLQKTPEEFEAVIIDYPLSQDDVDLLNTSLAQHTIPVYLLTSTVSLQHAMVTLHQGEIDYKPVLAWLTTIEKKERVFQDNKLFTLMYASHAVGETTPFVLMDILATARRINKQLGITGVLLFSQGWWLQILEGEFKNVTSLFFDHIQKDARHQMVTPLVMEYHDQRRFSNWDMGFYSTDLGENFNSQWTDLDKHPAGEYIREKLTTLSDFTQYFIR